MSGDLPGYSANQYPVIKSNGTIHFANNNKYSAYLEGANTYFGILDSTTTTRVFLATSGNTYFTGGNVGIGTVTPRKELDVQGNNLCVVAGQLILGEDAYLTSANYIGLKTSFQSGTNDYMILSGKSDGATYVSAKAGSSVFIRSGGNTSAAQIEVTDTYARTYSNLGVGTVPSQALDVAGNIRSSNVIYWNGITGALSWDTGVVTMETNTATAISLKTNGANRLYITSGGNVGIGTTNPVGKLDVRAGSGGKIILGSYDANYNVTFEGGDQLNFYYGASATTGYINYNGPGNILLSRNLYVEGNSSGGTTGAVRINSAGNVGIGLTNPGAKLQVAGTVATDSALADVDAYRIIKPNGGVRVTANSSETGAIKITYPVGWTNTMHRVKLNVYEYTTNESFTIYFGGYNYAPGGGYWYNVFAYTLNNPGVDRNFTVRFGYDGTSLVVYIGELASGWTYPQIFIEEVELGYSGQSSTWRDGAWGIGFEASAFQNVAETISNPQATNWARNGSSVYFENGSVGIGTTSPTNTLDVLGGTSVRLSNGSGVLSIGTSSGRDQYQYINLGGGIGGTDYGWQVGRSPQTGGIINDGFYIYDIKTNNAPFAIALGGNVGIGTNSPGAKLQIEGTTAGFSAIGAGDNVRTGLAHYDTTAQATGVGGQLVLGYKYTDAGDFTEGAIIKMYKENSASAQFGSGLKFQVRNTGDNLSTKVVINPSGYVGIGTTSPATKLNVLVGAGGANGTVGLRIGGTANYA
jgi:hypothetical protein